MFSEIVKPRFDDTDGLRHINNTVVAQWFEGARQPVFRIFSPDLDLDNWPLILAKYSVEFKSELFFGTDVEIKTSISQIGGSSFHVYQEVWQNEKLAAFGTTVLVYFDHVRKASKPIPDAIRAQLLAHNSPQ